jgi:phosphocarrier protein HPr
MPARAVRICNPLGLHARAAAKFVHLASRFSSRVSVERAGRQVDGKSILGVLLLAAASGTTITITAEGDDAATALDELCALVITGFGELS